MVGCCISGLAMSEKTFIIDAQEVLLQKLQKKSGTVSFTLEGKPYCFAVTHTPSGHLLLEHEAENGALHRHLVTRSRAGADTNRIQIGAHEALVQEVVVGTAATNVARSRSPHAPMPSVVREVLVALGDAVKAGQPLVVVEAMKLQTTLHAGDDGVVLAIPVSVGDMVAEGALLVEVGDAQ
jgi:biotin carboxyl carrier protein